MDHADPCWGLSGLEQPRWSLSAHQKASRLKARKADHLISVRISSIPQYIDATNCPYGHQVSILPSNHRNKAEISCRNKSGWKGLVARCCHPCIEVFCLPLSCMIKMPQQLIILTHMPSLHWESKSCQVHFPLGKPAEHSYRRTGDKEDTGFLSNTMGSLDELFSFCYCINCALWSQ